METNRYKIPSRSTRSYTPRHARSAQPRPAVNATPPSPSIPKSATPVTKPKYAPKPKLPMRPKFSPKPVHLTDLSKKPTQQVNNQAAVSNAKPPQKPLLRHNVAQQQAVQSRPPLTRQPIVTSPPKPTPSRAEYTLSAPVPDAPKVKMKKSKTKKLLLTTLLILIIFSLAAAGGYLYYQKTSTKAQSTISQSSGTQPTTTPLAVDFALYKPNWNSSFKPEDNYSDGKQQSKILIANSKNDNRQIVMTQQKVDNYFETDPNGLAKLLASTGSYNTAPLNNGMSYIVKGGTTAMVVKGTTLIIVRSTGVLNTQEWTDLFNNLESAN